MNLLLISINSYIGDMAQMVERETPDLKVVGSIPAILTFFKIHHFK